MQNFRLNMRNGSETNPVLLRFAWKRKKIWGETGAQHFNCKGGHPQFKSAPPQLCNIADNQIDHRVADSKRLQNCYCRPSKFDFRNSLTFHSLLPILLLYSPFSSTQDGFKNQPKIFLELSVSLETLNLP